MSKTIYIVTEGDYSDYTIRGVYSTKKKAEWNAKLWRGRVEEHTLNVTPGLPRGMLNYHVAMTRDGVATVYQRTPDWKFEDSPEASYDLTSSTWRNTGRMEFNMYAKDEKHATKIANERRSQMIAAGTWPVAGATTE